MSNASVLKQQPSSSAGTASAATVDRGAIENFLYREARFADESRYNEWLGLWTEDLVYWVPVNSDDYDPRHHLSIIYDNRERLQDRIDRLNSNAAWAQQPRSRMRRIVSNVEIEPAAADGDITVYSNFVLGELRRNRETSYYAGQVHRLRQTPDGLKMSYKKIMLVKNNEPIHNLTFIL